MGVDTVSLESETAATDRNETRSKANRHLPASKTLVYKNHADTAETVQRARRDCFDVVR